MNYPTTGALAQDVSCHRISVQEELRQRLERAKEEVVRLERAYNTLSAQPELADVLSLLRGY